MSSSDRSCPPNLIPRHNLHPMPHLPRISRIHNLPLPNAPLRCQFLTARSLCKIPEKLAADRLSSLDFYRNQPLRRLHQHIKFQSAVFAVMEQPRPFPLIQVGFVQFRDHPRFKNRPTQRVQPQLLRVGNPQQRTHHPAIQKMQLGLDALE